LKHVYVLPCGIIFSPLAVLVGRQEGQLVVKLFYVNMLCLLFE